MKIEYGDIWSYAKDNVIVVPTNAGYRADGTNIMGRGVAQQAAAKYPGLPKWYGQLCCIYGNDACFVYPQVPEDKPEIILFPTKPLNRKQPWLSWKQKSDIKLIEKSTEKLVEILKNDPALKNGGQRIILPAVGCGNGGLDLGEVIPILKKHLKDDRFILVLDKDLEGKVFL
jgi:hypothetical protein